MKEFLEAGEIVTTHGVTGEMKLYPWCDGVDFIKKLPRLYFGKEGNLKPVKLLTVREHKGMALITLEGVTSLDEARAYIKKVAYFNRNDIKLPEGRYYADDIIGCKVIDAATGAEYGAVSDVLHPGANDVYEVTQKNGNEILFPAVDEFIDEINPEAGIIKIKPIKGMFDGGEVNADAD